LKPVRDAETGLFYLRSDGTAGCGLERFTSWTQRSTFSLRLTGRSGTGVDKARRLRKLRDFVSLADRGGCIFLNLFVPVRLFRFPEQNSSRYAVQLLPPDVKEPSTLPLNYNPHNRQRLLPYTTLIGSPL
jgi:hypothetical protein